MSEPEVWHMRGEGGGIFEMTLPLDPNIEKRYLDGAIKRVNPDGSPWQGERPAKRSRARATASEMLEGARDAGVRDS
jgi:hypothetical protein